MHINTLMALFQPLPLRLLPWHFSQTQKSNSDYFIELTHHVIDSLGLQALNKKQTDTLLPLAESIELEEIATNEWIQEQFVRCLCKNLEWQIEGESQEKFNRMWTIFDPCLEADLFKAKEKILARKKAVQEALMRSESIED